MYMYIVYTCIFIYILAVPLDYSVVLAVRSKKFEIDSGYSVHALYMKYLLLFEPVTRSCSSLLVRAVN